MGVLQPADHEIRMALFAEQEILLDLFHIELVVDPIGP
ncbi:MAG: hypothetical protein ACI97B_004012, partial [Verrucomicrobiales bacterium]